MTFSSLKLEIPWCTGLRLSGGSDPTRSGGGLRDPAEPLFGSSSSVRVPEEAEPARGRLANGSEDGELRGEGRGEGALVAYL